MPDYLLKLFDTTVLRFSAEPGGRLRTPVVTHLAVNPDARHLLPLGLQPTEKDLANWLLHRVLPLHREHAHAFLAKFGLTHNNPLAILEAGRGLSLNDSYWIVREGFARSYARCNLYENPFSTILAGIALTGQGEAVAGPVPPSPEFTTNGMLPKCWRRQSGTIRLYKGGTEGASNTGNEPYSEYYAWQVAERLGVRAIPYGLARWKSVLCSTCALFTSKETSFVPVGSVVQRGGMRAVIAYYQDLGPVYLDALADMLVFDAVIANTDRHFGNFGFLVDARTNTLAGPAPLFDHGLSLFNFASPEELANEQVFFDYADTRLPACYDDFFETAEQFLQPRHRKGLRRLLDIRLKRHSRYNLPPRRLHFVEQAIQQRAARLLGRA